MRKTCFHKIIGIYETYSTLYKDLILLVVDRTNYHLIFKIHETIMYKAFFNDHWSTASIKPRMLLPHAKRFTTIRARYNRQLRSDNAMASPYSAFWTLRLQSVEYTLNIRRYSTFGQEHNHSYVCIHSIYKNIKTKKHHYVCLGIHSILWQLENHFHLT